MLKGGPVYDLFFNYFVNIFNNRKRYLIVKHNDLITYTETFYIKQHFSVLGFVKCTVTFMSSS